MPKPLVNNKITYNNIHGRIIQHDEYLNQGVQTGDSPTFANLQVTGDTTVEGNLYVQGNTTILDTNVIEFEDNIFLLNRNETGAGVTLNQAGFEVERGTFENYRAVFNEADDTFRIGVISNTQAVATREDTPLPNGFMIWNALQQRLDATNNFSLNMVITNTTNSVSSTTGAIVVYGGVGIGKDMHIDGKIFLRGSDQSNKSTIWTDPLTNNLNITSNQNINLTPTGNVSIPYNRELVFGSGSQSISANSVNDDLTINGNGNVFVNVAVGKRISVPNQIPITFSTTSERIYTDSSNNLVVAGGENIHLIPGTNKHVHVPVNIPLQFADNQQRLQANLLNDLLVYAGNRIFLNPGSGLDVHVPTDSGIMFGSANRLYATSFNNMYLQPANDLYLSPSGSNVFIPAQKSLFLGTASISANTAGTLTVATPAGAQFTNTTDSSSSTTGSVTIAGGLGVAKTMSANALIVNSTNATTAMLFVNATTPNVHIHAGNGAATNAALNIVSTNPTNGTSLIQFSTLADTTVGYSIGHPSRTLAVNVPEYSNYASIGQIPTFKITTNDYSKELVSVDTNTGRVVVSNTEVSVNATSAAMVVMGGVSVKDTFASGRYLAQTNATDAVLIQTGSGDDIYRLDTGNRQATFHSDIIVNKSTGQVLNINGNLVVDASANTVTSGLDVHIVSSTDTVDISTGALTVSGGAAIAKKLRVGDTVFPLNGINMGNTAITNLPLPSNPQDAASKAYVDLVKQGLYVKDSVRAATTTAGNLASDFEAGDTLDGYTLQTNDRILVKNQVNGVENGIYVVKASGAPDRSLDLAATASASGIFTFVQNGVLNGSLGWICNSATGDDVVGTDSISFTQFTGLGQVTAGEGLSKQFNQLDVNVDNSSLEIIGDSLRVKNTVAGTGLTGGSGSALQTVSDQSHVTQVGTLVSGVWQASTVQVPYGGTGQTGFTSGCLLLGNSAGPIATNTGLVYLGGNLGIGTSSPTATVAVNNTGSSTVLLNADTGIPSIQLQYGGTQGAQIGIARTVNDIATNAYATGLVVNASGSLQLATQQQTRLTVLTNGNIGIGTSTPQTTFDISGSFHATGHVSLDSTTNSVSNTSGALVVQGGVGILKNAFIGGTVAVGSTQASNSSTFGAVVVSGGIGVGSTENASSFTNGGAMTIAGGASIAKDLYVGGALNAQNFTITELSLNGTQGASNYTTGALIVGGGITLQGTDNATSISSGGGILTRGGASIAKDMYIGGDTYKYGIHKHYNAVDSVIQLHDSNSVRYSIERAIATNNFRLQRHNTAGTVIGSILDVDGTTGTVYLSNTTASVSSTVAGAVLAGGLSVQSTMSATSLTAGGGITVLGGQSVSKNLLIGGDVHVFSTTNSVSASTGALTISGGLGVSKNAHIGETLTVGGGINYAGNGLLYTITNTSGNTLWTYLGQLDTASGFALDGYCDIEVSNGVNGTSTPALYTVRFIASIAGTNTSYAHAQTGNVAVSADTKSELVVYSDSGDYHIFTRCPSTSVQNIRVLSQLGTRFTPASEGTGSDPNGVSSGYTNTWSIVYRTNTESTLKTLVGDLTVEGTQLKVCDNLPVIGYNNVNTVSQPEVGLLMQRFQLPNDTGSGTIISGEPDFIDTLPSQLGTSSTQVKLSAAANSGDDYYKDWWILVTTGTNINQVRRIISYNGSLRVAELSTPWTTQNPVATDTVYLFGAAYVAGYFSETELIYKIGFASIGAGITNTVNYHSDCDIQVAGLRATAVDPSVSSTTGSIIASGGIGISSTINSVSSTNGGALTIAGGAAVQKQLFVGTSIGVGTKTFTPSAGIHINGSVGSLRIQNDASLQSYIQFAQDTVPNGFGLVSDCSAGMLSLTTTTSGSLPMTAYKALSMTQNGYIGINTTSNIASPLTIAKNNFISTTGTDGFLGIIAGNTNTNNSSNGARMLLYGNASGGHASIYTGTQGSFTVFTNNDTQQLQITSSGQVSSFATQSSVSSTTGAVVLAGGVSVSTTTNATSYTRGGALTVAGGASVNKDVYIGGDLYVAGAVQNGSAVTTPTITFSNTQGCSVVSSSNSSLIDLSSELLLTFAVEIAPTAASQNCQFEFDLPDKASALVSRSEVVMTCSGYTDDTALVPLFNILGVGVTGVLRALVKFQSVSTSIHYLTVMARYNKT